MDSVSKTLYIPLYGKAYVSRRGIILYDPKAEEIWNAEGFPLKGKSKSKWLSLYMGMRSAVFDSWLGQQMEEQPDAVILHIGCGMDARCLRVGTGGHAWYDIDFPEVIVQRKRYYPMSENYKMLGADVRKTDWMTAIPGKNAIVIMEGVGMYLQREELRQLLVQLCGHFDKVRVLMDCYSEFAAKASRFKNPINDVGVTQVYGLDDPIALENTGLQFLREHDITPDILVNELQSVEKCVFKTIYAGPAAGKMYRLYEYRK